MPVSDADALKAVEELLESFRQYRGMPATSREHRAYVAMKMAADEIRSRMSPFVTRTVADIQRSLDHMEQSKHGETFSLGCLRNVALQTRAHWSTIRQALVFFEDARKVDAQ